MEISLSRFIESDAVIYAVRLGLCLKTECTMAYLFDVSSECGVRITSEEVADIELYSGLVGVDRHLELVAPNLGTKTKAIAKEGVEFYRI